MNAMGDNSGQNTPTTDTIARLESFNFLVPFYMLPFHLDSNMFQWQLGRRNRNKTSGHSQLLFRILNISCFLGPWLNSTLIQLHTQAENNHEC